MKTESVRNRTVCNDLNTNHTSATPKILKNRKTWEICLLIFCKKNQLRSTLILKMTNNRVSAKVSVFQQDQINCHPSLPKGLTWQFIETKSIKHDYYSILIM